MTVISVVGKTFFKILKVTEDYLGFRCLLLFISQEISLDNLPKMVSRFSGALNKGEGLKKVSPTHEIQNHNYEKNRYSKRMQSIFWLAEIKQVF